MASMYDTIMELPLFKGIGVDQLSALLEKTSLEFLNFEPSSLIFEKQQPVNSIDFILKGSVKVSHVNDENDVVIEESIGKGNMIGANHMYGLQTKYNAIITAETPVSLLRITKEQYRRILLSDEIYLINYLNYLSAGVQRASSYLLSKRNFGVETAIGLIIKNLISPMAEEVSLIGSDVSLSSFLNVSLSDFQVWVEEKGKEVVFAEGSNKRLSLVLKR